MLPDIVGSWEIAHLPLPVRFFKYSDAYLDSAGRLCKISSVTRAAEKAGEVAKTCPAGQCQARYAEIFNLVLFL